MHSSNWVYVTFVTNIWPFLYSSTAFSIILRSYFFLGGLFLLLSFIFSFDFLEGAPVLGLSSRSLLTIFTVLTRATNWTHLAIIPNGIRIIASPLLYICLWSVLKSETTLLQLHLPWIWISPSTHPPITLNKLIHTTRLPKHVNPGYLASHYTFIVYNSQH